MYQGTYVIGTLLEVKNGVYNWKEKSYNFLDI